MKRLVIMTVAAFAIATAPVGVQPQANEAHHSGKSTKVKKSQTTKPKQTKKPAAKVEKSSQRQNPQLVASISG